MVKKPPCETMEEKAKEPEDTAAESELKFQNIIESSPMGIHMYQLNPDGQLIFTGANPAADRILGINNEQFVGKTIEEAFPPLVNTEVPERYRKACESGESWQTEQIEYQDEKIRGAFEVHAFQTSPGNMAAMFFDITERKRAEEKLKKSEIKYRQLFEKSTDALFVVEKSSGRYLDANAAAEELTGYSMTDLKRLTTREVTPEGAQKRLKEISADKDIRDLFFKMLFFGYVPVKR